MNVQVSEDSDIERLTSNGEWSGEKNYSFIIPNPAIRGTQSPVKKASYGRVNIYH